MIYRALCIKPKDAPQDLGDFPNPALAWERLIRFHEDRLDASRFNDDRVLRRLELRSEAASDGHERSVGVVSGPDPIDPSDSISYSVREF